jgi:hypothetical protein
MRPLPLDSNRYTEFLADLRALVEPDSWLNDRKALRRFFDTHRASFGPRTASAMDEASDDLLRTMLHVAVLAATELADLHEESRKWLAERGHSLPPWDVTVPRSAQRMVSFGNRIYGVVEWEPVRRVLLAPGLDESERTWATALAVGIGERPQWTNEEVCRYAAYLVMGVDEFSGQRWRSDDELAAWFRVPADAVRFRRELPDHLSRV